MTTKDGYQVQFTQPTRQIAFMVFVLILVAFGAFVLGRQIQSVFYANIYLNGVIAGVFLFGVLATFWQVAQLIIATSWLKNMQAGHKGHEFVKPPRLLAAMAPMIREGQLQKRMATSSTRSILDSIADRLDEMRDLTRYITSLLIFLGLLGTFWGLSITVPAVVDTIRSLAPQNGQASSTGDVFERLMTGLESQLGGMGTAFASSLLGLAGSLVVGLLELFAGHGQNRFYRELEDWLASFTRLGLISEGEGPEGGLIVLLERIDQGLEMTTNFAKAAEEARIDSEKRLGRAADVMTEMANQMEKERALIAQLVREMREAREMQSGRDHATLTVLKRIEAANEAVAGGQQGLAQAIERGGGGGGGKGGDGEMKAHLQNVDMQLREIAHDLATGRRESTAALRAEIRALINLIDTRTRPPGSK